MILAMLAAAAVAVAKPPELRQQACDQARLSLLKAKVGLDVSEGWRVIAVDAAAADLRAAQARPAGAQEDWLKSAVRNQQLARGADESIERLRRHITDAAENIEIVCRR